MKEINQPTALTIYGQNELKRISLKTLAEVIPQLEKYASKKIFTAQGVITAKTPIVIEQIKPNPFKNGSAQNNGTYLSANGSRLWLKVKICLWEVDKYTQYFENYFCIGEMENGQTLVSVDKLETICENYNLNELINSEELREKVSAYNAALETAENLRRQLPNFLK